MKMIRRNLQSILRHFFSLQIRSVIENYLTNLQVRNSKIRTFHQTNVTKSMLRVPQAGHARAPQVASVPLTHTKIMTSLIMSHFVLHPHRYKWRKMKKIILKKVTFNFCPNQNLAKLFRRTLLKILPPFSSGRMIFALT